MRLLLIYQYFLLVMHITSKKSYDFVKYIMQYYALKTGEKDICVENYRAKNRLNNAKNFALSCVT